MELNDITTNKDEFNLQNTNYNGKEWEAYVF